MTHLTAPARFGGLESVVSALATGLAARGHTIRVIALLGVDPADRCVPFRRFEGAGVELVEIRLPARRYGAECRRVQRLLSQDQTGILHTHGYHADVIGYWAARGRSVRLVSTVHGFTGGGVKNRAYEWLGCRALGRFDRVIPVSRPMADRLTRGGVDPVRVEVIPNASDGRGGADRAEARRRLGLSADATVVGWVGRLTPEKAPDQFLEAMGRTSLNVQASIIGDGPMRPALEAQVRLLGIGERVRWHGVVEDAGRLLSAFDVLLISSRREGTPIVLLEAMAAGVPLVATAVGGIPDMVGDGEAVLVPPDHPDLLAHALQEVLAAPDVARARVVAARARVESRYGMAPWLDRYEVMYRRLRGAPPRPA